MNSNQTIQQESNHYLHQVLEKDSNNNMQLEGNFNIEEEVANKNSIEGQDDDEEAAIVKQNNIQLQNHKSQQISQRDYNQERFSASCNLPIQNSKFMQSMSAQNSDSTQIPFVEREHQSSIENSICQTFVTFQERPRSDSQNLQVFNQKNKSLGNQQMHNYNVSTMNNEILSQQWRGFQENITQNSFEINSTNQFTEKNTNKNNLSGQDSMEDETSSLSNSQPAKKQKKAISKVSNGSPQSGSLQSSFQKIVNRKKSNTINTSIFSTASQKKERIQYQQIQKEMLNFNNSDIINHQLNKLEENTANSNNNNNNGNNNNIMNNSETSENDINEEGQISVDKNSNNISNHLKRGNNEANLLDNKNLNQQQSIGQNNENQSKKVRFTAEEDEALIKLIQIHGKKWKVISELMDGKNETRIRNRYYSYIRKILKPGEVTPTLAANNQQQEEYAFDQINLIEGVNEQNNPESFQEQQLNLKNSIQVQNGGKNINGRQGLNNHEENNNNKIDNIQIEQQDQKLIENHNDQYNNLQQSIQQNAQPFFNSTLFESLNALTLNNFDKNFNSALYDGNFMDNQNYHNNFQSNPQDSLLVQSYNQLCQFPFSSNNLNFDYLNNKIPSFKFINGFEGSLANLDANQTNFSKSYLYNQKSSLQDFEVIDAEDFNQKFYRAGKESHPIFNSNPAFQDEENLNQQNQQAHNNNNNQKSENMMQNFCPNRILRSLNEKNHYQEEPSPLIFAKAQKKYDPKRFANINPDQAFQNQNPVSHFSMEEEMDEDYANKQTRPLYNQNDERRAYMSMSDNEKIQKIMYLNSQVENIQTLIQQCKQQILNEIISKNQSNV
ncbi:Myb-like DNA-binding domain protein (macronuclear) [Tetrahymena thermophila SB210]|uniref:Myb-like DNA-binding domain protein n=1 Tax=Tetrahymena thermophila (strain SB210) TaxID=312017 RepID=Q23C22_TETTS|nr:Myb-like DNA-binding domain protein [Tetrahymena thermophila SB210]EAR93946.1 Myb-like DNA-binding domain protein [Tetrahymena thermophila SB210]|eukprot:XP_001014191.1 Myb-like DNA-binding domain protein [Tetrahymena thermophila SB210]